MPNIRISPSRFKAMMTKGRGKEEFGATFYSLAETIAMEAIGVEIPDFTSFEMQHGIDNEPLAISAYEKRFEVVVLPCFERIVHPLHPFITGEPDGLVSDSGGVEIKCPNPANHMKNLLRFEQLPEYIYQIQGYMWLTDRDWWDFASFDPRFPEPLQLAVKRIDRDNALIAEMEQRALKLYEEVNNLINQLTK